MGSRGCGEKHFVTRTRQLSPQGVATTQVRFQGWKSDTLLILISCGCYWDWLYWWLLIRINTWNLIVSNIFLVAYEVICNSFPRINWDTIVPELRHILQSQYKGSVWRRKTGWSLMSQHAAAWSSLISPDQLQTSSSPASHKLCRSDTPSRRRKMENCFNLLNSRWI